MVSDNHYIPYFIIFVHPACSIRDKKVRDAENLHYTDRKCNHIHSVSFIKMESALHSYYKLSSQITGYKITLVTHRGRDCKIWNLSVRNHNFILNSLCQFSQAASEYYTGQRSPFSYL